MVLIIILSALVYRLVNAQTMDVWLTTGDQSRLLSREPSIVGQGSPGNGPLMEVNTGQRFQSHLGVGAALSNSAAYVLYSLSDRSATLNALFSPTAGIGINYIRLVMGGSDFNAVQPYTYDDMPPGQEDFNMDSFSIEADRAFVIPLIKEILNINPSLKIMASPWSPPAWMKNSNSLSGGELKGGANYLAALSRYFLRFIQAYQAEGIAIDAITLQNEPYHADGGYPTMFMNEDTQAELIRSHVGPTFQQNGISTKILAWDHNWDVPSYPLRILDDPSVRGYVSGSAWHCYAGNPDTPGTVQQAHPDKDIYFTECSGGTWDESFPSVLGWNTENLFIGQMQVGSRTTLLWNLALDQNHGPRVGVSSGCTNCRGVLTVYPDRTFTKNVEYYAIGQFGGNLLQPGATRVWSTWNNDWVESVVYQNPDGSYVAVLLNTNWSDTKTFSLHLNGLYYTYPLPPRSVVTLKST